MKVVVLDAGGAAAGGGTGVPGAGGMLPAGLAPGLSPLLLLLVDGAKVVVGAEAEGAAPEGAAWAHGKCGWPCHGALALRDIIAA